MKTIVKVLFCLAAIILLGSFNDQVIAQDTIVKTNKEIIVAKVLEINPTQVKYNRFDLIDGPVFVIYRSEVESIRYSNGITENFVIKASPPVVVAEPTKTIKQTDVRSTDFGHHFFYISLSDLAFKLFSGGYEYTMPSGKFSIGIPLSFGMANMGIGNFDSTYSNKNNRFSRLPTINPNKIYSVAMSFRYYVGGQGMVRYFFGPTVEYGEFNSFQEIYNYQISDYDYVNSKETYGGIILTNGVLFQPLKNLNINAIVGLAIIQRSDRNYNNDVPFDFDQNYGIQGAINIGFKF